MGLVPLLASPKTLETKMTGLGSPCGACKFLRRKCVRGCVFAPHFSHEQGATHFSAIHKVFGASNVSKLLMQIPMSDRSEAAITISYEAQARIQDPVYGCVGHIFALQQQVANLQAQLASLKEQVSQIHVNPTTAPTSIPHNSNTHAKFSSYQEDVHEFFHLVNPRIAQPRYLDPHCNNELSHPNLAEFQSSMSDEEQLPLGIDDDSYQGMPCIEVQMDTGRSAYEEMQNNFGDLRSVAFSFLRST